MEFAINLILNMTDINQVTQVANGVSDYGMMAVTLQSMLEVSETTAGERVGDVLLSRAAVWVDALQIRWDGGL